LTIRKINGYLKQQTTHNINIQIFYLNYDTYMYITLTPMMIYIYMSEEDPDISIKGLGPVFGVVFFLNRNSKQFVLRKIKRYRGIIIY